MCFALCQFRHDTELARSILAKDEVNSQFSGDQPWGSQDRGANSPGRFGPLRIGLCEHLQRRPALGSSRNLPIPQRCVRRVLPVVGPHTNVAGRVRVHCSGGHCVQTGGIERPEHRDSSASVGTRYPSDQELLLSADGCQSLLQIARANLRSPVFCCLWEDDVIRLGHFQLLRSNFGEAVHSRFEVLPVFAVVAGFECRPCSISITGNRPVSRNEVSNAARRMESGITGHPCRCRVCSQWQFHHARHCYADLFGAVFRTDGPRALCQKSFRIFRLRWAWRTQQGGASASHQRRIVGSPHSGIVFC